MENEEIPSYAPSNNTPENLEPIDTFVPNENSAPAENKESSNQPPIYRNKKKSKKKIIIPIIIVLVLLLSGGAVYFFKINTDYNSVLSYNHWRNSTAEKCDPSVQSSFTQKPSSTNFFNQICASVGDFDYVSAATNVAALSSDGAVEAYIIKYKSKSDPNNVLTLYAATFNDSNKQNAYYDALNNSITMAKQLWQNGSAVYGISAADENSVGDFYELINV